MMLMIALPKARDIWQDIATIQGRSLCKDSMDRSIPHASEMSTGSPLPDRIQPETQCLVLICEFLSYLPCQPDEQLTRRTTLVPSTLSCQPCTSFDQSHTGSGFLSGEPLLCPPPSSTSLPKTSMSLTKRLQTFHPSCEPDMPPAFCFCVPWETLVEEDPTVAYLVDSHYGKHSLPCMPNQQLRSLRCFVLSDPYHDSHSSTDTAPCWRYHTAGEARRSAFTCRIRKSGRYAFSASAVGN